MHELKKIDECISQINDAETEDLIESYKSFLDEMNEKGFDDEYIRSFDDYKKFRKFQMKFFNDFICFGNLQLETLSEWNEEVPQAKILYLDFDYNGK